MITEKIKPRNDFFDQQKQLYQLLLQMQNEVDPTLKHRRIEADALHFIQ